MSSMPIRHMNQLMGTLDEVANRGWAFVDWWKLRLWYGVKKLRKEPYRDIQDKWKEINGAAPLKVVNCGSEGFLLLSIEPSDISEWV